MPPTLKVVVAHCAGVGLWREEPEGPRGGTLIFPGAIFDEDERDCAVFCKSLEKAQPTLSNRSLVRGCRLLI